MPTRREVLEFLVALVVGGAVLTWVVVPELLVSVAADLRRTVPVLMEIPEPAIVGGVLVVATLVWLAVMGAFVEGIGRIWTRVGGSVTRLVGMVLPESALWRFATGLIALLILVFIIIGVLPSLVTAPAGS